MRNKKIKAAINNNVVKIAGIIVAVLIVMLMGWSEFRFWERPSEDVEKSLSEDETEQSERIIYTVSNEGNSEEVAESDKNMVMITDDSETKETESKTNTKTADDQLPEDPEKRRELEEKRKYLGFEDIFEGIRSKAAILVRYRDDYLGGVVAEMNADEILDPASTTKLMTALVMAEHLSGTDTMIEIPGDVFGELDYWGASTSGFSIGEKITPEDCLHGILMKSGADACYAAARAVSGDEDVFVELMNQKAEDLGMTNSHYMNVTGLGISGHYTSARDMVVLLQACYENEAVREALCCLYYTSSPTPEHPEGLDMQNNMLRWDRSDRNAGNPVVVIGSKTGFITAVGQNLCSVVLVNGEEIYFLVTMGAPGNNFDGETVHYQDQSLILDHLTEKYEKGTIHMEPLPE